MLGGSVHTIMENTEAVVAAINETVGLWRMDCAQSLW